jgi:hypothetical protein
MLTLIFIITDANVIIILIISIYFYFFNLLINIFIQFSNQNFIILFEDYFNF